MSSAIPKDYSNFSGVNLALPQTARGPLDAELMQDCVFLPSGSVSARPGWKYRTANADAIGFELYIRDESGTPTRTRLVLADRLYQLITGSVLITYSGASSGVSVTVLYDTVTAQWRFQIIRSASPAPIVDLDFPMGLGYEGSPITLANLKTAIDAIAGGFYVTTLTGDTAAPAAFLPILYREALVGSGPLTLTIEAKYRSVLRKPDGGPNNFVNTYAARNAAAHRNATGLNHRQVIYLCTELDKPQKFDGTLAYNMGLPACLIQSVGLTGGGALTASWNYEARFSHRDAKLNYIGGSLSDITAASPATSTSVDLTFKGILTGDGYSTDHASVNGNQAGVNAITVTAGHKIQAGDYVALLDRSLSGFAAREAVYRKATAVGATSITIDGAAVNVSNGDVISQCLLLEIYRTKDLGSVFYAVTKIPFLPGATITFSDTITDANLGEEFIEPLNFADPPPMGGVITAHQGLPVITRITGKMNRIAWEDESTPEGFPAAENFRDVYSKAGGVITGLWSNEAGLDVFFETSSGRISGTLFDGQLDYRQISKKVGLPHQHCLEELDNGYAVYISQIGMRQMGPGGVPEALGYSLDTLFKRSRTRQGDRKYVLERARVMDYPNEQMCYFFLNCESTSAGGTRYSNSFSEVWVLDYQTLENLRTLDYTVRKTTKWVGPWKNINMGSGALVDGDQATWIEKRFDAGSGNVLSNVIEINGRKDDFDQVDHNVAINMRWLPGFEDLGTKFIKKVYEYLQLYSADLQNQSGFTLNVGIQKNFVRRDVSGFTLTIGAGGDANGFGLDPFGQFAFGNIDASDQEEKIPCTEEADNAAKSLSVVFSHSTIFSRPIISAFGLMIKVPYEIGLARK